MGRYLVWSAELGQDEEDGCRITAWDEETAAREWAESHDRRSAEYSIASGTSMVVSVKDVDSGVTGDYSVSGEAVPSYRARKVPNDKFAAVP